MKPLHSLGLFFFMLTAAASDAFACKPAKELYDLQSFLESRKSDQVVFVGRVSKAEPVEPQSTQISAQRIEFDVQKIWRGPAGKKTVTTVSRNVTTHSCSNLMDFSVKPNENWLIVGTKGRNGEVQPNPMLSTREGGHRDFQEAMRTVNTFFLNHEPSSAPLTRPN
jgi:hypothetical protein